MESDIRSVLCRADAEPPVKPVPSQFIRIREQIEPGQHLRCHYHPTPPANEGPQTPGPDSLPLRTRATRDGPST